MPSKVPKPRCDAQLGLQIPGAASRARPPSARAGGLRHALPKLPDPQILRRSLPLVGHFLIAHLCTLIECAEPSFLDRGDVHEHILAAVIGLNESIALCRVEPLHRSGCHLGRLPYPIRPKDNLMPICKASKTRQGEPAGPEYGLVPTFLPNIRELTRF